MPGAKILVFYPYPKDVEEFERVYAAQHTPMVTQEAFPEMTKFVATKVVATPDGSKPLYHRVAELHFPSLAALQAATASAGAQKVAAHAASISSGGAPVVMVAEEDVTNY